MTEGINRNSKRLPAALFPASPSDQVFCTGKIRSRQANQWILSDLTIRASLPDGTSLLHPSL
jgi:hypothetical protein